MAAGNQLARIGIAPPADLAAVEWLAGHPDYTADEWSGPLERSLSLSRDQQQDSGPCWDAVKWRDEGNASEQRQFTVLRTFDGGGDPVQALLDCWDAEWGVASAHEWAGTLIVDRASAWNEDTGTATSWKRRTATDAVVQLVAGTATGQLLMLTYVVQFGALSAASDYPERLRMTDDTGARATDDTGARATSDEVVA